MLMEKTGVVPSFIISHSSCAEQYGDMSSDTQTHTHTIKPPTAGVQLVGHISVNKSSIKCNSFLNAYLYPRSCLPVCDCSVPAVGLSMWRNGSDHVNASLTY